MCAHNGHNYDCLDCCYDTGYEHGERMAAPWQNHYDEAEQNEAYQDGYEDGLNDRFHDDYETGISEEDWR